MCSSICEECIWEFFVVKLATFLWAPTAAGFPLGFDFQGHVVVNDDAHNVPGRDR